MKACRHNNGQHEPGWDEDDGQWGPMRCDRPESRHGRGPLPNFCYSMQTIFRLAEPYSLAKPKYAMHIQYEAKWIGRRGSVMLCYTKKRVWYFDATTNRPPLCN